MGIWKGLWVLTTILMMWSVALGDTEHFGIHAVGHAVEPFCPGGYSDRGDHCNHIDHAAALNDDFDDTYRPIGKLKAVDRVSMSLSQSESTKAAEVKAVGLGMEELSPEEEISNRVTILGH